MVRGQDALRIESDGGYVQITAELVRAAKQQRKDRATFKRAARLLYTPTILYYAEVTVSPTAANPRKLASIVMDGTVHDEGNGAVISLVDGVLAIKVPISPEHIDQWTLSKVGTRYIVIHFFLPLGTRKPVEYAGTLCLSRWDGDEADLVPGWVLN